MKSLFETKNLRSISIIFQGLFLALYGNILFLE
ncbi:hypothetical protein FPSM_00219 [Flavobacterium psychrophilum]|nr:hypothetical protein FPSM_00219 [Flavobacterium psychrophilum]